MLFGAFPLFPCIFGKNMLYIYIQRSTEGAVLWMNKELFNIYDGDKPYLFISYSHADEEAVFPLLQGIQEAGYRFWMDRGIEVGTEWSNNIADRLRRCEAVIFFVSKHSVQSENCLDEIACAKSHKKSAVLIYLEEDVVLPAGVDMQTARFQRMYATRHHSIDSFVRALNTAPILETCREKPTPADSVESSVTETPVEPPVPVSAPPKSAPTPWSKKKVWTIGIATFLVFSVLVSLLFNFVINPVLNAPASVDEVVDAYRTADYSVIPMLEDDLDPDVVGADGVVMTKGFFGTRALSGLTDEVMVVYLEFTDVDAAKAMYDRTLAIIPDDANEITFSDTHRRIKFADGDGECVYISWNEDVMMSVSVDFYDYFLDMAEYDNVTETILDNSNL